MKSKQIPNYKQKEVERKWQKAWQESGAFSFGADACAGGGGEDEDNETDGLGDLSGSSGLNGLDGFNGKKRDKYYVLEMFPFPSGKLHMGHLRNYSIGDVIARFYKMKGYDVLHPMGWDAFGLPAENAALAHGAHPEKWVGENIDAMREELKSIGLSYDWKREIATCSVEYYKHEQKIFLDFLKNGLAYQKESFVNWDPVDCTVLANEQVVDGRGWRSGAVVEKKKLKQWFLKVSDFAEDLLGDLKGLKGWPDKVRLMQEKWIGRSEGLLIDFEIAAGAGGDGDSADEDADAVDAGSADADGAGEAKEEGEIDAGKQIRVYTTRADTLFGASFVAISPNHPLAEKLAAGDDKIADFIAECNKSAVDEASIEMTEKKGVDTGLEVKHPFDENWKLPVYIANFVLMDYGTGAVFACPAHDQRDFDFARKYNLPIKRVIGKAGDGGGSDGGKDQGEDKDKGEDELSEAYVGDGTLINSEFLNAMSVEEAKEEVAKRLERAGAARRKVNYRLRDWGVSRQRYWGCPIPILYLEDGTVVPVPEEELPVELPKDVDFSAAGNPLDRHPTWKYTTYKGQKAVRETDTFDTFFESSWYFARFCCNNSDEPLDGKVCDEMLPVDQYIGGVEHAVLHLLYARFFTKALKKCGYVNVEEPFENLLTQGMVCHKTYKYADGEGEGQWVFPDETSKGEDGEYRHAENGRKITVGRLEKMSKSKKNVVEPAKIVDVYGADTARLFMLSDSPPERDMEWSDEGVDGAWRYVNRLWKLVCGFVENYGNEQGFVKDFANCERSVRCEDFFESDKLSKKQMELVKLANKTIDNVGRSLEKLSFNSAIARIREFSNYIEKFEAGNDDGGSGGSSGSSDNDGSGSDAQGAGGAAAMHYSLAVLSQLVSPFTPHLAQEMWEKLGGSGLLVFQA